MKFVNVPAWDITFGVPPKCGSSSVHAALQEAFGCENLVYCDNVRLLKTPPEGAPLVFVVRHPLDRFKSLWKNKCRDNGKLAGHGTNLFGLTPAELFDYISGHHNHHWTPQSELLGILATSMYTDIVALEDLTQYCVDNVPYMPPVSVYNKTNGVVELSVALEQEITDYYADDVTLYEVGQTTT